MVLLLDKNVMGINNKPICVRGQGGGEDNIDKNGSQNQGNMKCQYRKLKAHFCSAASQVCPRHYPTKC